MAGEEGELFSVRQAAQECGRNPETIRRWIWSGKLPAEKLGNQLFIKRSALESYCRETATMLYQAGARSDLIKGMRDLRGPTRAGDYNAYADIDDTRRQRTDDIQQSLCEEAAKHEIKPEEGDDFLERAIRFRNKLRARGYRPVDAAELVRRSREGRMRELRQSLR